MRLLISAAAGLFTLLSVSPAAAQDYPPLGVSDCASGPSVIRFERQSSEIRVRQIAAFNDVLRKERCRDGAQINVESFIVPGESDVLAARRALAVRAQLIELGLPEDRIHIAASHAAANPRVTVNLQ